ncbi:MAG: purine-binding chemotaxis protein CheW [Gammaproteobacteria bacterium]|nr:purine-binding chemotaxis protein CheW [Gammaproteobacteria bacterium]
MQATNNKTSNNAVEWMQSGARQFLTFFLNDEEYGVDILQVNEIREWTPITTLPETPSFVKGVINLRGNIVPIIDLRALFNFKSVEYGPTTVVIVLNINNDGQQLVMGIVVDAVSDTHTINQGEIKKSPNCAGSINIKYLQGLVEIEGKLVLLLDIDKLLTDHQLEQIEQVS